MQADGNLANADDDAMSPLTVDYLASGGRYSAGKAKEKKKKESNRRS